MNRTGKIVFESRAYVVCIFDTFMTVQRMFGNGMKMDKSHQQFEDWSTAFDDIDSVSEGNRLCREFLRV